MSEPVLQIRNLSKSYFHKQLVLHDVSLDVKPEEILIIIGPSGAGKSTLMRCINHLITPSSGHIYFKGLDIPSLHGHQMRACRRRIGMVFQEFNLVERLTVLENLLIGRLGYMKPIDAFFQRYAPEDIDAAEALLTRLGLQEFALKRADEPTSSLDPKTSVEVMETMAELARERHIPVLVNMHDVSLARRFADRIVGMREGRIVFDGKKEELTNDTLAAIYGGDSWMH